MTTAKESYIPQLLRDAAEVIAGYATSIRMDELQSGRTDAKESLFFLNAAARCRIAAQAIEQAAK